MSGSRTNGEKRAFGWLDYFIWFNWLANFGRSFSGGSTWLFLR